MTIDKANEVLEKAIELLGDDSWVRGVERSESGGVIQYCALGALRTAAGFQWTGSNYDEEHYDHHAFNAAVRRANATAVWETDEECGSIVGFNDRIAKSAEDVRLMLKRALRT